MSTRIHKPEEAEAAFRAALERSPNNGWVAAGLLRAAEMRGDADAAAEARMLMQKNWFGTSAPELSYCDARRDRG